ncbi:uncharacterized protein LOC113505348 [Trichoplusia ni]|uniref:Uncharacterized protein LOC113505348 n=1 Tax=Trichoplusia ni TaxID=7111 RepID=A0A7E5WSM5_TRINI|nr:uncharacterized protein LOC113505348 [Trichoplusia ni]
MGVDSTSERISNSNYEYLLNSSTYLENLCCLSEAENIEANNNLIEGHAYLELEKKTMFPINTTEGQKLRGRRTVTPAVNTSTVISSYAPLEYNYPLTLNECFPIPTPFCLPEIPIVNPPPIFPQISQFPPYVIHPVMPVIPTTFVQEDMMNFNVSDFMNMYCMLDPSRVNTEATKPGYYIQELDTTFKDGKETDASSIENQASQSDPLDQYLSLPRQLFPTARMLALDPNPIINEFCKMPNMLQHTPWLLDLEFGIPKSPVTRPIPIYNVKFNSIHCKNTPNAIHPGFEMCDPDFKKVLLFYYDFIVSAWYRGYVIANSDRSVENFQTWLLNAMRVLGMCWP